MTLTKHLVKIENNIITEAPQYYEASDGTAYSNFNNSEELMLKYGFDYELTDAEYSLYKSGMGYTITDNEFVDITDTDAYKAKIRLFEIETELKQATKDYENTLDTAVAYTNGHTYKPSYASDTYIGMLSAELILHQSGSTASLFPKTVKDSTKLSSNAVSMTFEELMTLSVFLSGIAEEAWNTKATKEDLLLTEKATLEATIND